jgi:hypothetical protein
MSKLKDIPGNIFGPTFNPPKPPKPPEIKSPEEVRVDAAELAAEELRKRRRGGRGSTILTGSLDTAPTQRKTLLGQ